MEKMELRYWWEHSDEKNMNKLVEWKAKTKPAERLWVMHVYLSFVVEIADQSNIEQRSQPSEEVHAGALQFEAQARAV